jgi:hypothetical protein
MLTANQLSILRDLVKSPLDTRKKAWPVNAADLICFRYDVSDYFSPGSKTLRRLLVAPGLLSISPDGQWCKPTDFGRALYDETEAQQQEWEELPIIPLDDAEKDQIIINAGETFRGKIFVTQLFKRARTTIRFHDNFCAHELLTWLYSASPSITIQILTSPKTLKQDPAFESLYRAFKQERRTSEVRLTEDVHDRKIIIDDREALQVGESVKDIGRKGTTIVRLKDVSVHIAQFDALWNAGKPL